MRLALCLVTLVALSGCAGEAPTDPDPIRRDGGSESSADAEDDTGAVVEDTGNVVEDSGGADAVTDTRTDAPPMCPTVELEPNNSIPSSVQLKEIDDCDGSGGTFKGMLAGGSDPDFWHYKGNDKFGCVVDATASTKTAGVRLCVFVSCASGTTELKSCKKGMKETSPGGVLGCCTSGPGEAVVEHGCPLVGTSDSADVYIRVDAPGTGSMCTAYEVAYHF